MQIKIGCREYAVDFEKEFDSEDIDGSINYTESTIHISKNLSVDYAKETLLHEVLHGISDDAKLHEFFDESIIEKFITVFTPRLLQTFKDNKDFREMLN